MGVDLAQFFQVSMDLVFVTRVVLVSSIVVVTVVESVTVVEAVNAKLVLVWLITASCGSQNGRKSINQGCGCRVMVHKADVLGSPDEVALVVMG